MWLFKPHSVWTGPHVAYPDPNIRLSTPGPPEGKVHRKGKGKKNKKNRDICAGAPVERDAQPLLGLKDNIGRFYMTGMWGRLDLKLVLESGRTI